MGVEDSHKTRKGTCHIIFIFDKSNRIICTWNSNIFSFQLDQIYCAPILKRKKKQNSSHTCFVSVVLLSKIYKKNVLVSFYLLFPFSYFLLFLSFFFVAFYNELKIVQLFTWTCFSEEWHANSCKMHRHDLQAYNTLNIYFF